MTAEKAKSASGKSLEGGEDGYVRLHISPFDANLFGIVVPSAVAPLARNISYHEIETFPERRYGYVELPVVDAEKIRKKLNGATLKGAKMKVEKARPEARPEPTGEEPKKKMKEKKTDVELEEPKKRKRDRAVEGVSLGDRKVKRGWTEGPTDYKKKTKKDRESKGKSKDDKRTQQKSKYTESPECLFKTRVPPNATGNIVAPDEEEAKRTKKKKKGNSRDVVVHEFEKTTKFPSFLKMSSVEKKDKDAAEYVSGKGWVDEDGNVVEEVKEKVIPKPEKKSRKSVKIAEVSEESDNDTSSSGSSTSEDDSSSDDSDSEDKDVKMEDQIIPTNESVRINAESKDASSILESDSEPDSSNSSDSSDDEDETTKQPNKSAADASVTSPERPSHIDIPPPETPQAAVHPLEALYKRDKDGKAAHADDAAAAAPGGFSFFGADIDADEENDVVETTLTAPMTPYAKHDFEFRNVRSAAPTPDTSRKATFWGGEDEDGDDVDDLYADDDEDGPVATSASSDFQKWFWENRGDLNRSWMTRRKTAAKEKRHRENKARASKA